MNNTVHTISLRAYILDREIMVTDLSTGQRGLLAAGSLVRNERTPSTYPSRDNYETLFDASTDGGLTWSPCGTNDQYETKRKK
jgi:hypothetical protein